MWLFGRCHSDRIANLVIFAHKNRLHYRLSTKALLFTPINC